MCNNNLCIYKTLDTFNNSYNVYHCTMFLQVVEKIPSFWKSDVDFIKPGALFTISWKNVFIARPGTIKDFNVYMSSFPEGKHVTIAQTRGNHNRRQKCDCINTMQLVIQYTVKPPMQSPLVSSHLY